jgi:hypothetical protein
MNPARATLGLVLLMAAAGGALSLQGPPSNSAIVLTELDFDEPVASVLYGDANGDGTRDAILLIGRRVDVHYYHSDGTFSKRPDLSIKLPADAAAIDLCSIDPPGSTGAHRRSVLLAGSPRGIESRSLDSSAGSFVPLKLPPLRDSLFARAAGAAPIAMTLHADFDRDGSEELLLPLSAGIAVMKQFDDGWHSLGVAEAPLDVDLSLGENRPGASLRIHYELPRAAAVPIVRPDGRKENVLAISRGNDAWVYRVTDREILQLEHVRGLYRFDAADNMRDFRGTRRNEDVNDRSAGLIAVDLDSDGIPDFVASRFREGEVYITRGRMGDFVADAPSRAINADGWVVLAQARDVTGDGRPDLIVPRLPKLGIAGALKALLSRKVSFDLWVYKNTADAQIVSDSPDWKRSIDLEILLGGEEGKVNVNARLLAAFCDTDGDGRPDFVTTVAPDRLGIFRGEANSVFSDSTSMEIAIPSVEPWPEADLRSTDVNGDGKEDLLIVYGSNKRGAKNKLLFIVGKS